MQIDFLTSAAKATASLGSANPIPAMPGSVSSNAPFAGVLADAMSNLKGLEKGASSAIEGLVGGGGVDIHAAMIATQKSDLAFDLALAVRGKVVSAYQTMMGVQF